MDKAPLMFEARLGGLFPANRAAEEAMREVKGRVTVTIKGGVANQRRRGLYWCVAALVVPLLNQRHGMTLDEKVVSDMDYVVLIGNSKINGTNQVLDQGQGYAIVKLNH